MDLGKIIKDINCTVLTGSVDEKKQFNKACGSDLMSDVLANIKDDSTLLLTGLCNQQVIRTAEMIDLNLIVFVRGKRPTEDVIRLAEENNITLLATTISMFDACGILYQRGMRGIRI